MLNINVSVSRWSNYNEYSNNAITFVAWKQGNVVAAVWSRCRGSVVAWTALQTTVCETKSYKYSLPTNKVPNFIIKKLLTQNLAPVEGFLIKTKKLWLFYSKFRHIPNPDQWHCKFSNRLDIASKKILFFRNPWFPCKLQVSGVQQPPAILADISKLSVLSTRGDSPTDFLQLPIKPDHWV